MGGGGNMGTQTDDNWLNAKIIRCPACAAVLFQVDHSPMEDAWRLYCERCPKAALVSFYDRALAPLRAELTRSGDKDRFFRSIEERLRPCDCSGAFLFNAARRCYKCQQVVTKDHWVDLHPSFGGELDAEVSQETIDRFEAHERKFLREDDLWR